ncbi:MAG: coenzyme F420-0:L-glutamate ligase [Peptococcaceae bacterium]|nr:coenzyme F420-0:L-glutamate ligase [Peptococcaceae bacterium]
MDTVRTVARGLRAPLIKAGDDIVQIVVDTVLTASQEDGFELRDKDVIGITEAVVARAQGNYASCTQIAADIRQKYPSGTLALTFPILSRNRFSNILKGIAQGCDKLYMMLSYPADEVGNELIPWGMLDHAGVNPYTDVLTEEVYREKFGYDTTHVFTNMDYVKYYKSFGGHIEILFANDVRKILSFTKNVLCCDVHTRLRSKRLLKEAGAESVYGLDDVLSGPVEGSGYNEQYGLLGSNKAAEDSVKLFPRDCEQVVKKIAQKIMEISGRQVEVMVYGDGAFKDPVGMIWELADPVVSPAFTPGLEGTPNELKLKLLLDNEFSGKSEDDLKEAVDRAIKTKTANLEDKALGTTPRRYTDLLGSLCDLMSGSGDKGTPIVLIQGYFDNYAS